MIEALYPERLQKLIEEERARQAAEEIQRKTTAEEQRKAAMEPARVEKLKKLVGGVFLMESEAGPTLALDENAPTQEYKKEKIDNWDPGRRLRATLHLCS